MSRRTGLKPEHTAALKNRMEVGQRLSLLLRCWYPL
jgi:hypothetical protein